MQLLDRCTPRGYERLESDNYKKIPKEARYAYVFSSTDYDLALPKDILISIFKNFSEVEFRNIALLNTRGLAAFNKFKNLIFLYAAHEKACFFNRFLLNTPFPEPKLTPFPYSSEQVNERVGLWFLEVATWSSKSEEKSNNEAIFYNLTIGNNYVNILRSKFLSVAKVLLLLTNVNPSKLYNNISGKFVDINEPACLQDKVILSLYQEGNFDGKDLLFKLLIETLCIEILKKVSTTNYSYSQQANFVKFIRQSSFLSLVIQKSAVKLADFEKTNTQMDLARFKKFPDGDVAAMVAKYKRIYTLPEDDLKYTHTDKVLRQANVDRNPEAVQIIEMMKQDDLQWTAKLNENSESTLKIKMRRSCIKLKQVTQITFVILAALGAAAYAAFLLTKIPYNPAYILAVTGMGVISCLCASLAGHLIESRSLKIRNFEVMHMV